MYHFPPTPWEAHGICVTAWTVAYLIIALIAVAAWFYPASSRRACGIWAAASTFFLIINFPGPFPLNPASPPNPLDENIRLLLPCLFAVGMAITLRRNFRGAGDGGRGVLVGGGSVLMTLVVYVVLFVPATLHPRTVFYRTECKNRLKSVALAMHNYHDVYLQFHPAWQTGQQNSWRVGILPYLDEDVSTDLFHQYNHDAAWDSPENQHLSHERLPAYDCPHRPEQTRWNAAGQFLTPFVVPVGDDALFNGKDERRIRDISDGTSNTLMILEACGNPVVWTQPKDLDVDNCEYGVNRPSKFLHRSDGILSSYHLSDGAFAAMADGSVRFFSRDTAPDVLRALITAKAIDDPGDGW